MKKLYIFTVLVVSLMLPLGVFAAVDIMIEDTSSAEEYSVSITVDTDIDTLDEIVLPIEFSDNVIITSVSTGTIICSDFNQNDINNILTISCELDSPTSLNGVLATIDFTSTSEDYSFVLVENDSSLNIGGLDLGMVSNIESAEFTTMDDDLDMGFDNDMDMPVVADDDFMVTTEESPIMEEQPTTTGGIMDYLPYILIGGSVVLLISIIGILLTKKGSPPKKGKYTPVDKKSPNPVQPQQQTPQQEGTLRDMVNSNDPVASQQTPPVTSPPPVQDTTQQTGQPPVASAPVMPEVQPMQETPPSAPTTPVPPTPTPPTSPSTEEQDLQDILKSESSGINMRGASAENSQIQPAEEYTQPSTAQFDQQPMQQTEQAPTPQPMDQGPQTTTTITPEEELQNNVQQELGQFQSTTQNVNTDNTPTNDTGGINLQQDQTNTGVDDSNMPPTPPAM
jgi:hypothetical protein